jgi:TorA maturation chaperone TorD
MELLRALAAFAEEPGPAHPRLADLLDLPSAPDAAVFTECFVFTLYPYASVHLGPEGQLGGVARDRVAGFFRALDAVPGPEPDHLAVLLTAYSQAREGPRDGAAGRAADALLHEHLLSWLPLYLARVRALAPPPYPDWALLLERVLRADAAQRPRQDLLSLHLRAAPRGHPAPDGSRDDFLAWLLAPVRSGMVLTGSDLRRAAVELGLGVRVGERRFVLKALLDQDPAAVLRWLADHARTTVGAWRAWRDVVPGPAGWWTSTADAAASHLRSLAADVSPVGAKMQP